MTIKAVAIPLCIIKHICTFMSGRNNFNSTFYVQRWQILDKFESTGVYKIISLHCWQPLDAKQEYRPNIHSLKENLQLFGQLSKKYLF